MSNWQPLADGCTYSCKVSVGLYIRKLKGQTAAEGEKVWRRQLCETLSCTSVLAKAGEGHQLNYFQDNTGEARLITIWPLFWVIVSWLIAHSLTFGSEMQSSKPYKHQGVKWACSKTNLAKSLEGYISFSGGERIYLFNINLFLQIPHPTSLSHCEFLTTKKRLQSELWNKFEGVNWTSLFKLCSTLEPLLGSQKLTMG